jgi:hypothetical protein
MTKGINNTKSKKKPWKTKVERDVYLLRGSYLQNPDDADIVKKLQKKSKK